MPRARITAVYITASSLKEARMIASHLLNKRLIACANILPSVESLYYWKGKRRSHQEVIIVAKTVPRVRRRIVAEVRSIHSYDVPCIVFLPVDGGNPAFLSWVAGELKQVTRRKLR